MCVHYENKAGSAVLDIARKCELIDIAMLFGQAHRALFVFSRTSRIDAAS
jgi:hypothetical protein